MKTSVNKPPYNKSSNRADTKLSRYIEEKMGYFPSLVQKNLKILRSPNENYRLVCVKISSFLS